MNSLFIQIDNVRIKKSNIKTYGKATGNSIEVFKTEQELSLEQKALDQEYKNKLKAYENKYFKDNKEKNIFKKTFSGISSLVIKIIKPKRGTVRNTKYENQQYVYVTTYQNDNYRFCQYYETSNSSSKYLSYIYKLEQYNKYINSYPGDGVTPCEKPEEVNEKYIYREDFDYNGDKILEQLDSM